jgi:putative oxidoreductase
MTMTHDTTAAAPGGLVGLICRFNAAAGLIPYDLVALAARMFPAVVFWQSGRTKVDGFAIKDSTWFLFQDLYAVPLIPPAWAAVMATVAEHVFPVLLVLGLLSRFSALGLLAMAAVIQIFDFPEAWVTHGTWVAALLVVAAQGPGRLSVDYLLRLDRGRPRTS